MFESSGRRSGSLSCSYYFPDESPVSGATPIRSFSGSIPFSWEHLPGIPKKQSPARFRRNSGCPLSSSLLPLPPNSTRTTPPSSKRFFGFHDWRKPSRQNPPQPDPFFDAFIECSKLEPPTNGKPVVTRSLTHRFRFFNIYSSCKRTGGVSESIVYLPRARRTSFDLLNHRTGA